ncbi:serine dehydratase alpha chain [Clostridium sp. MSTE9]|uniref:L-cysteine desulfidase family protein n=1 Tax=Clostridium sp. (strain MSTE9) TaxID=1105031 RepID=UPI00026F2CAA|nr:L-serine ammonia-lyase, iron-sulfur-dependent, subunit alpha [Clostridium sp. MSTE9]EJF40661.1 serine dehydratase alpha chain [Clostridium sp. MSTE9]
MDQKLYQNHLAILKSELIVALGCTEPIAIAFAAAKARETLGQMPEHCVVRCSGNIIKNVKGVVVPKSQGMRGMEAAAALGIVGGDASQELAVLESVKDEDVETVRRLLAQDFCTCELAEGVENLYILISVSAESHSAEVEIKDYHNNITKVVKDGAVLYSKDEQSETENVKKGDKTLLNLKNILEFADCVRMEDIEETIGRQIAYNTAISEEGLKDPWGAQVGRTLVENSREEDIKVIAAAAAAAGSDARMSGCSLPVVINSGSGNQGITITMPVVAYARRYRIPKEKMYAALCVANLVSIHQKKYIGSLSAYCGAVSAAAGAACGIAYMNGAGYDEISQTITNTICTAGGIVCDGAKSSCAAKIAASVTAALTGWQMASKQRVFQPGEGLVEENVEDTIANVGRMGREGMRSTDVEILNMMLGN